MKLFMKIIGVSIVTSIITNGIVNTTSRIRRDKLENENYKEEILRKKEERLAKKAKKEFNKTKVDEIA